MNKTFIASILSAALILQGFLTLPAAAQTVTGYGYAYPSPQPSSVYCPTFTYNLYRGLTDYYTQGQVSQLQQFLAGQGYYQTVTGYFGPMTASNVAQFQQRYAVYPVTGGVGPLTRAAIYRLCNGNGGGTGTTGLSVNPTSGQAPLTVNFTGQVTNSAQYIISFGDGATSGPVQSNCYTMYYPGYNNGAGCSLSVSHTYTTAGTYTATLSPYISCMYTNPRCEIATQMLGQATVYVSNGQTNGGLTVTSPTAGQTYARGTQMPIAWSGLIHQTFAYEQDSSIVDLYTAVGSKVGTIAIQNGIAGSFTWSIPPFPNNLACIQTYPNGLCGQNLQGQYYIKVTAVVGNGFDSNPTVIGTAQSGVFTIQ